MKCSCIGVILHSSVTATSMNTGKFIFLFYDLEFILLNFRVEIDFNDNFESYMDCSRLKFYEIIKFTFLYRSLRELCSWRLSSIGWAVQTCRRGQADFVCCHVGVEYGGKVTSWTGKCVASCRDSKLNQPEQKKKKNNADKDRRPPTVDRAGIFTCWHKVHQITVRNWIYYVNCEN